MPIRIKSSERFQICSARICRSKIREITFRAKFSVTEGCWIWQGSMNAHGYGVQCHFLAHRLSWIFHVGSIPQGMKVLHKCDMPACVNPDHLFLGTQADNLADMRNKQRGAIPKALRGQDHPHAKHTNEDVKRIRSLYKTGIYSQREVALIIGTTRGSVCGIVRRKTWTHIP